MVHVLLAGGAARLATARLGGGPATQRLASQVAKRAAGRFEHQQIREVLADSPLNTSGPVESALFDLF